MPTIASTFQPPAWLRHGHLQTLLPAILPRRHRARFEPERLELPDGDFLDLAWVRLGNPRLALLSHGLEGDAHAGYIRGMASTLSAAGWDVLAWNFRGCGPQPNRLVRFYHSGETEDLRCLIGHAAPSYGTIALVGFSLGGNMTLKYLGEALPHPSVRAAVAISVPVDLASTAQALDARPENRVYLWRFLKTLIAKVEAKARNFPDELDARGVRQIRSFMEFDDRYTARLHGFADAADYWARSSARPFLKQITVPTLLLNALDDPFLTRASFPVEEAAANPSLTLETPACGGHVGFVDFRAGLQPWSERRTAEFLSAIIEDQRERT